MRTKSLLYAAAVAMACLSCARGTEDSGLLKPGTKMEFTADWADEKDTDSRTVLQDDGTSIWWSANEEINVFIGNDVSAKFVSTNTQPQGVVSFVGNVLIGVTEQEGAFPGYWAAYPYDAENSCDGQSITLSLPCIQEGKANGFADKFFPAVARSNNFLLSFWNVCGGARFSVTREGIRRIVFRSNDGSPMSGKVQLSCGEDNKPQILDFAEPVDSVVVKAPEGGFVPGTNYFAAMLPHAHAEGLTATLYTADRYAVKVMDDPIVVKRSVFGMLDSIDEGLTDWEEYEPEKQILKILNSIYFGAESTTKSSFSDHMSDNPIPAGTEIWINDKIYTIPESREIAVPAAQRYYLGYPADNVSWTEGCVAVDFPSTVIDRSCAFYGYCEYTQQSAEVQLSCLTGFLDIIASSGFSWVRVTVNSDAQLAGYCLYGPMQDYTFGDQGSFPGLFYNSAVLYDNDGDNEVVLAISPQSFSYLKMEFFNQDNQLLATKEASRSWTCNAGTISVARVNISLN